jgi:hypothetical protein
MGYTSYWRRPLELDEQKWEDFVDDVKKLRYGLPKHSTSAGGYYENQPLKLVGGNGEGQPMITNQSIWFNGTDEGNLSHETFHMTRVFEPEEWQEAEDGLYFNFCKTARKPYDLMVALTLIAFKHHFDNEVKVSSDGNAEDFEQAVEIFREVIGKEPHEQFITDHSDTDEE